MRRPTARPGIGHFGDVFSSSVYWYWRN